MIPTIKPHNNDKYVANQSNYEMMSELPTSALVLAPSNSGKSVLLVNILLNLHRGCFEKVYFFNFFNF
jgi:fido (protein-threonine AMPylation protein)